MLHARRRATRRRAEAARFAVASVGATIDHEHAQRVEPAGGRHATLPCGATTGGGKALLKRAGLAAFPLNEKQDDPIKMYLNDVFTVPASLAGIPGISIPYGHDKEGLPLGIQLLGKHFNEQEIFNAAFALEKDYE